MGHRFLQLLIITIALTACSDEKNSPAATGNNSDSATEVAQVAQVDAARLLAAESDTANWMTHGRTYAEQRYSPLKQLDPGTVADLGLAWSFDLETQRGIEATSLVVDGVMYTTSAWSIVHALDARSGKLMWTYDPQVARDKQRHLCCGPVNRGVAVWQGQIFVGTIDGRLEALDAATGKLNWSVATVDPELPFSITGAPRVINGLVLIGNGGAEFGVRGFIAAYDVATGDRKWQFHTVPGNPTDGFENDAMKMAADTWKGEWWEIGGGGTVWDSMAYDPELDLLYIGVGNGTPWNREIRSPGGGDNLFLSSIVALRPGTGEYVWHYQTTPGETWDYTATQHIILADMEIKGSTRKVLMQAPKNGFFYVIDRTDGSLISANNYIDLTWATHVDMETGRPVEVEGARYTDQPFMIVPSYLGGHNWHPMSYNPNTGLVYIPVLDFPAMYGQPENFRYRPGGANTGADGIVGSLPDAQAERDALRALMKGRLLAWNPVTNTEAWHVEHAGPWNGGTLTTAGNLVFQGIADGKLVAFRADTGEQLWDFATQTGVVAAPVTYELDGEQYLTINAGWGGAYALVFGEYVRSESLPNISRVLTFKLGGRESLPAVDWQPTVTFNPPEQFADADAIRRGFAEYQDTCMGCHGLNAVSGLLIPDLRGSAFIHDANAWKSVVIDGSLAARGMAAMSEFINEQQAEEIRAYVIEQAIRGQRLQKQ